MSAWLQLLRVTVGVGLQRGLGALLPLVLAAIATREQGLEGAGIVGIATALALIAIAVTDLGVTPASLRDFPQGPPTRREFMHLFIIKLVAGVIGAAVLAAAAWFFASREWALAIGVAAVAIPPAAITALFTSKLAADGDGVTLTMGAVLGFVVGVTVALVGASAVNEPWALLLAIPAGRFAEAGILFAGSAFPPVKIGHTAYGPAWVLAAWPMFAYWLVQVLYLRAQVIVPGIVLTGLQSGEVVNGFNVYSAATLLPGALALAAWPRIARATARAPRAGLAAVLRYAPISVALMSAPVVALFVFPEAVTRLIFDESSSELSAYVRWGAAATMLVGPNGLLLSFALSLGRARAVVVCYAVAFLASAGLQFWLSSAFGVAGAGAAVFLSEVVHSAWLIALCARSFPRRKATALAPAVATPLPVVTERNARAGRIGAAGLTAVLAGILAVALAPWLVFPDERTGLLLILPLPVITLLVIRRLRYDVLAPASIFALAWTGALAIAQIPFLDRFTWSGTTWVLLTVPPLGVVAGAVLGAGPAAIRSQRLNARGISVRALPLPIVTALGVAGALAWANYFRTLGAIPLFSQEVDILRFSGFDLPTLIGTRLGYVGLIFAVPGVLLARSRKEFLAYGCCVALGLVPLLLSGGRLYAVSGCAIGAAAAIFFTGFTRRMVIVGSLGFGVALMGASALWFVRLERQPPNAFRSYVFDELVEERPFGLAATIPTQMFASISMQTLSDLVNTQAYVAHPGEGYYSTKFADRLVPGRDLEAVARAHARFEQVTSTYVGQWYADFGMAGVIILSLLWGLLNGVSYRAMAAGRHSAFLYLYAYASFFLPMAVYLNYWTLHGVWLADVPLIIALPVLAGMRLRMPLRRRYEPQGAVLATAVQSLGGVWRRRASDDAHPPLEPPDGDRAPRFDQAVDSPLQG